MSLPSLEEIALAKFPIASVTDGVVQLDVTASAQRFIIPAKWKGRYVKFSVHGEKVEILFGGAAVAVTFEDASTVAAEAITMKATTGFGIPAGGMADYYIPAIETITHFSIVAASTTGKLYAHASSL